MPGVTAEELDVDVCVVGAGLAGLAAADAARAGGRSVIVLEARDRVGGRLLEGVLGGIVPVDLGGQWMGAGHTRLAALASRLGIASFPTWDEGDHVLGLGGRLRRYSGTIPRLGPLVLLDLELARRRIDRLARRVPAEAPWDAEPSFDGQSFESWMRRHMRTRSARTLLTVAGRTVWGAEPAELSLLHVLFYASAAGGINRLVDTDGGAQQDRFDGTAHGVAAALAGTLGDAVRLEQPVRAVRRSSEEVIVESASLRVRAGRVVLALPPALTERIAFDPPLPGARRQLAQRMPLGNVTKIQLLYDEPFWREDGLSGAGVSGEGPVTLTFDSSPRNGSAGVLTGFVGGADARAFAGLSSSERREAVLRDVAALFGGRAAHPEDLAERAWADEPWSGGGPVSNFGPGGWTACGPALRAPLGRIHFAGTETATVWCGYMEGALQSAERVVAELT